ncbi:MAG: UDP-N-acetylglucosamine 2-epimerase (non-hydrolyzing) [Xanthomonadaceae bacterium]|nr:UDP-N-acetylglucosamine 2-epimerase (non-hydrolyzing) [Xanthomonadaceae bacterium]
MKIMHVVGARPNFMKIAPIMEAFDRYNRQQEAPLRVEQVLVHTGQHYDRAMSELFFEQLGMPRPDINLNVGSGSHGRQTGRIMEAFEQVLLAQRPDLVLVVGDVNSTLACAIDAKKLSIPVAHVEAGLRSGDMSMPEEINRVVTDAISDLLFTTDCIANAALQQEGVAAERIHFVGNVMIDTLLKHRDRALQQPTLQCLGLARPNGQALDYAVVTLHRPGNVDDPTVLREIVEALAILGRRMPVIFPVHPRSRARLREFGLEPLLAASGDIRLLEPLGYLDFVNLTANCRLILTDSGGIQEESTILGVPCLTLRPNTERPITISQGTNRLVGNRREEILAAIEAVLAAPPAAPPRPELWDGRAAERIVEVLVPWLWRGRQVASAPVLVGGGDGAALGQFALPGQRSAHDRA